MPTFSLDTENDAQVQKALEEDPTTLEGHVVEWEQVMLYLWFWTSSNHSEDRCLRHHNRRLYLRVSAFSLTLSDQPLTASQRYGEWFIEFALSYARWLSPYHDTCRGFLRLFQMQ